MKIAMVNHSDIYGGAARAAWRIHHALRQSGVNSQMYVNRSFSGDWTVAGPQSNIEQAMGMLRSPLGRIVANCLCKTNNPILHSPALLPSSWPKRLNKSDSDIVHLHWVNNEMMSVTDIARISKPVVWTLHDMWAFCGAEHYTEDYRWRDGYNNKNRPTYEFGFDLNRWTWQRKRKSWKKPMHIVAPSHWLAECARTSALMQDWPISVIPNTLDVDSWQPVEKKLARHLLNLPTNCPLLAFGAISGGLDPRKGMDLLLKALDHLRGEYQGLQLLIFGQNAPKELPDLGFPVHYTGHLHDTLSLRVLYSAADAMIVPSRQEAFGQTASEAQACGTPVIAFDACGLPDIVVHKQSGWLARPFDTEDLAMGIKWVLDDQKRLVSLSKRAREIAVEKFSFSVISNLYADLYIKAVETYKY